MKGNPVKIIDYGSNWGYVSFQFKEAGFETQSFEISKRMSEKGQELLGLEITSSVTDLTSGNNVFFTSHVIEHLSDINILLATAKQLLTDDGYFIAYSPNGSADYKRKNPETFHKLWGMVHPNFMNEKFYCNVFKEHPYLITSSPYPDMNLFENWDGYSQVVDRTDGEELLVICRINKKIPH